MNKASDEREIRGLIEAFAEGWNGQDGLACARPFAEDADFINIMGLKARGREVIGRGHEEILATVFRGTKLNYAIESIRFVRPDVAVGDATLRLHYADGAPFPMRASSAGFVAGKQRGQWSIVVFRNMIPFERPAAGPMERALAEQNDSGRRTTAQQEIEAALGAMFAAWNRGDLEAYVGFWSQDGELVNVMGMHRRGRAEILAELEFLHATRFRGTQIRDLGHSIRCLAPEIAVVHVRWEMRGDLGQPGHEVAGGVRRGIFTHTVRRTDEGWRLASSQNTDIQPIPDFLAAAPGAAARSRPTAVRRRRRTGPPNRGERMKRLGAGGEVLRDARLVPERSGVDAKRPSPAPSRL